MILAGDIGGTKTALALFEPDGTHLRKVRDAKFPSRGHASFDEILDRFLGRGDRPRVAAACFGVAGAVLDGRVHTTNLPWTLDQAALGDSLRCPNTFLLNDLESAAYAMPHTPLEQLHVLNSGVSRIDRGHAAVIAAGTGLGEACLVWNGDGFEPFASEGGHADFAPQSELEDDLLRYLRGKFAGHVSYERVLSGPGLFNIYSFLRDSGHAPEPAGLAEQLASDGADPSRIVSEAGLAGTDENCRVALRMFASIYGAEAGNLALKLYAVSGVYIAGGIAPKILAALTADDAFLRGFWSKGRYMPWLKNLHVAVALDPEAPLLGSAYYARHRDESA